MFQIFVLASKYASSLLVENNYQPRAYEFSEFILYPITRSIYQIRSTPKKCLISEFLENKISKNIKYGCGITSKKESSEI